MHQKISKILAEAGIDYNEAKVEATMLIEHFGNTTMKDLIIGKELSENLRELIVEKAKFRAKTCQPIQYIIGYADFMGDKYAVNPSVLIPRDDTEILVSKAIEIIKANNFVKALDLCTGSGCIACSIAKNTQCCVLGTDISTDAIEVAFSNMERMKLFNRAFFRKSDLFERIREEEKFDIIISNPPYIPLIQKSSIQKEVLFEPDIALYASDAEGLEFYSKIVKQAHAYLKVGGYLMFELGQGQSHAVKELMNKSNYQNIEVIKDLSGIDRVILGQRI